MNDLLGMFGCFRKEDVALMTDIKSMLHQFVVAEEHRDLLRWQFDGHPSKEVIDYRMKVHLLVSAVSHVERTLGLGEQLTMAKKSLVQMLYRNST